MFHCPCSVYCFTFLTTTIWRHREWPLVWDTDLYTFSHGWSFYQALPCYWDVPMSTRVHQAPSGVAASLPFTRGHQTPGGAAVSLPATWGKLLCAPCPLGVTGHLVDCSTSGCLRGRHFVKWLISSAEPNRSAELQPI